MSNIAVTTVFNPPLPVRVPPDLDGEAIMCTDYGKGHHRVWTVVLLEGSNVGCMWDFPNPDVRRNTSISDKWKAFRPFTDDQKAYWAFLDDAEPDDADEP